MMRTAMSNTYVTGVICTCEHPAGGCHSSTTLGARASSAFLYMNFLAVLVQRHELTVDCLSEFVRDPFFFNSNSENFISELLNN